MMSALITAGRQIGKQGSIESAQIILEAVQIMPVLHQGGLTEAALTEEGSSGTQAPRRRTDSARPPPCHSSGESSVVAAGLDSGALGRPPNAGIPNIPVFDDLASLQ